MDGLHEIFTEIDHTVFIDIQIYITHHTSNELRLLCGKIES